MSAFSGQKDQVRYTEFVYTEASQGILRMIPRNRLPMQINQVSVMGVLSEGVASEQNIRCKLADWKLMMADGNWNC